MVKHLYLLPYRYRDTQNMSAVAMMSGDWLPQGIWSWLAKLREMKSSEELGKVDWQRKSLCGQEWMGQGTLTERKSQKGIKYLLLNGVCEIFKWAIYDFTLMVVRQYKSSFSERFWCMFVSIKWKGFLWGQMHFLCVAPDIASCSGPF